MFFRLVTSVEKRKKQNKTKEGEKKHKIITNDIVGLKGFKN